jgi:hypothetical protein
MPTDYGNAPGEGPLRQNGTPLADPLPPGDLPNAVSKAAERQQPAVLMMRDVVKGTERVRDAQQTYLPQAPGEDPANYKARLLRSVFFNVTGRTVEGLVGQVFRVDPELGEDVPVAIRGDEQGVGGHAENIDLAGTHFDVFARAVLQDALTAGHAGILVEFPKTGGTQSAAAEKTIRPYWVPIRKDDILSWRTAIIDGQTVFTQVVFKECTTVPAGKFGEKEQTRYRDIDSGVVGFALLQIADDKKSIIVVDEGTYPTQTEIPFAEIVTSGRQGLLESIPPLLDLAYLNLTHYQTLSDYLTSIHKTCVPVYVESGVEPDSSGLVIGPNTARQFSNPDAKAMYVSHDGAALGSVEKALENMKAEMGTLGIAMLAPQKQSAETATAHRQDKSTEDSALAVTARGLQDGLERALGFHAKYLRLPSGGSVTVNREFNRPTMEAAMLTAWTSAVSTAGVPERFMLADMQRTGLIPTEENVEEIAEEMETKRIAQEDAEQQRQADLLAMKQPQPAPKAAA